MSDTPNAFCCSGEGGGGTFYCAENAHGQLIADALLNVMQSVFWVNKQPGKSRRITCGGETNAVISAKQTKFQETFDPRADGTFCLVDINGAIRPIGSNIGRIEKLNLQ